MSTSLKEEPLAVRFLELRIGPAEFHHREHLEVAYQMLLERPFLEALNLYAGTIQTLAARFGSPDKYNLTITVAFMSYLAERMASTEHHGFDDFMARNPDLGSPTLLKCCYSPERLSSPTARHVFLLPDRP